MGRRSGSDEDGCELAVFGRDVFSARKRGVWGEGSEGFSLRGGHDGREEKKRRGEV